MSQSALNHQLTDVSDGSVNFGELLQKLDDEFGDMAPSLVERFRFCLDGLNFDIRRVAQESGHRFLINATLGYLPFTIESAERREAIKIIVMASRALPTVHFVVDHSSKISAGALINTTQTISPDFIFYPLVLFVQEARPFIELIGKYLYTPAPIPTAIT
jgi:hypothetical protein